MRSFRSIFCTILLLSLFSCKKDEGKSSPTSLVGTYKFISQEAVSTSSTQVAAGSNVSDGVVKYHYFSKNNTGTYVITSSTWSTNNLSFSIDTTAMGYEYSNGILKDSTPIALKVTVGPFNNSVSSYRIIGSDSIYFPSSSAVVNGITQQTTPEGEKFKFSGNRLYLYSYLTKDSLQASPGVLVHKTGYVYTTVTLEKM